MTKRGRGTLATALLCVAAAVAWAMGARVASPATFLLAGLSLAIAFSGAFTLAGLGTVGALDLVPAARRALHITLALSATLLLSHFAALAMRRVDLTRRLAAARKAVERIEARRSEGRPLPGLEELGPVRFTERTDGNYLLCFSSAGQEGCYDSRTRKWTVTQ